MKWLHLLQNTGDASSQASVSTLYASGRGVTQDNVYAHMWGDLGSSNCNKNGGKLRDLIAKTVNPGDISKAQYLARECAKKKYKGY